MQKRVKFKRLVSSIKNIQNRNENIPICCGELALYMMPLHPMLSIFLGIGPFSRTLPLYPMVLIFLAIGFSLSDGIDLLGNWSFLYDIYLSIRWYWPGITGQDLRSFDWLWEQSSTLSVPTLHLPISSLAQCPNIHILSYHQARFFSAKADKSAFVELISANLTPPPQLDSLPFLKSSGGEVEVLEWRHFGNLLVPRPMEGLR